MPHPDPDEGAEDAVRGEGEEQGAEPLAREPAEALGPVVEPEQEEREAAEQFYARLRELFDQIWADVYWSTLLILVCSVAAAGIINFVTTRIVLRIARKTKTTLDDDIVAAIGRRWPLALEAPRVVERQTVTWRDDPDRMVELLPAGSILVVKTHSPPPRCVAVSERAWPKPTGSAG